MEWGITMGKSILYNRTLRQDMSYFYMEIIIKNWDISETRKLASFFYVVFGKNTLPLTNLIYESTINSTRCILWDVSCAIFL